MKKYPFSKIAFSFLAATLVSFSVEMLAQAQTLKIPLCNGSTTSLTGVTMKLQSKDFGSALPWEYDITNGLIVSLTKGVKYKTGAFTGYACPSGFTSTCTTKIYYSLSPTAGLGTHSFTVNVHEDGAAPITTQDILNIQYYPELNGLITSPINTSLTKVLQMTKYDFPPPSTDFYYLGTGLWNKMGAQYVDTTGPALSGVVNLVVPANVAMPPPGTHFTLAGFSVGLVAPAYTKGCLWVSAPTSITLEP